jgi:hypothetical protein
MVDHGIAIGLNRGSKGKEVERNLRWYFIKPVSFVRQTFDGSAAPGWRRAGDEQL